MHILGRHIVKGESATIELKVAKLHTRNSLNIPVIIERSKKDGPVLLLIGGVHGDEINGVAIVQQIIKEKINKPTAGTVICIPVFNTFGFLNICREFPDGRDLNRVFPGSSNGSLASQFAHIFVKEIAPHVDYIIDFHTGGAYRENIPQLRCDFNDKLAFDLSKVFNPKFIIHSECISKSLRETLVKMKKTVLLFEGGKSKNLSQKVINAGVQGVINVMSELNMTRQIRFSEHKTVFITQSKWLRAPSSGLFRLKVKNGTCVQRGEVMGVITDPFGTFERKVKARYECFVFCVNTVPIINKGDAMFHISEDVLTLENNI